MTAPSGAGDCQVQLQNLDVDVKPFQPLDIAANGGVSGIELYYHHLSVGYDVVYTLIYPGIGHLPAKIWHPEVGGRAGQLQSFLDRTSLENTSEILSFHGAERRASGHHFWSFHMMSTLNIRKLMVKKYS